MHDVSDDVKKQVIYVLKAPESLKKILMSFSLMLTVELSTVVIFPKFHLLVKLIQEPLSDEGSPVRFLFIFTFIWKLRKKII